MTLNVRSSKKTYLPFQWVLNVSFETSNKDPKQPTRIERVDFRVFFSRPYLHAATIVIILLT